MVSMTKQYEINQGPQNFSHGNHFFLGLFQNEVKSQKNVKKTSILKNIDAMAKILGSLQKCVFKNPKKQKQLVTNV